MIRASFKSTRLWRYLVLVFVTLSISSCYGVSSQHYFAIADLDSPNRELTFYRIKIQARSFLTASQYSAGFYDAEALHQLYGEVKNPNLPVGGSDPIPADATVTNKTSTTIATSITTSPPTPPATRSSTVTTTASSSSLAGAIQLECDPRGNCRVAGGANDRFTVIYGANAAAVADQIRSFSESDNTGKQIGALLAASTSADVFERTAAADQSVERVKKNAATLAADLKALADQLGSATVSGATDGKPARLLLLRAAQQAVKRAGSSVTFDTTNPDTGLAQAQVAYEALSK